MSNPRQPNRQQSEQARSPRPEERVTRDTRRVPMGTAQLRLAVPKRKGYVRRWFVDKPGRLARAQQAGYQFVTDKTLHIGEGHVSNDTDLGNRISEITGRAENGAGQRSYLMEIREDWYQEDQATKAKDRAEIKAAIAGGTINNESEPDTRYVPEDGIKIEVSRKE